MIQIKEIREKVTQRLKDSAIPGILDKVYPSRARKIWNTEDSLILVYTENSTFEDNDTAPVIYNVETDILVEIICQGGEELDDRMDELTQQVIDSLIYVHGVEGPFDGSLEWIYLKEVSSEFSAEGEILKASQSIRFSGMWRVALPDETPPDDFLTMGTDLGPPTDSQAEDLDSDFTTNMRTNP